MALHKDVIEAILEKSKRTMKMTEVIFEREGLKSNLQSHIMTVVFEKADGSLRQMRCTLLADYLPEYISEVIQKRKRRCSGCMGYR
jgi:hypothetical protein